MGFLDAFLAPWTDHPSELRELRLNMASTKDMVTRLNAATDELANDLADFRAKVANQDASLAAELDPIVSRLERLGEDPKDPVPDAPAEPETPAEPAPAEGESNDGEVSPETIPDER